MKLNENGDVKKSSRIKEMGGGGYRDLLFRFSIWADLIDKGILRKTMKGLKVQALWYLRGASPVMEQGPGRRRRGGGPGTFAAGEASDAEPLADGSACVCREHCRGLEGRTPGRPRGSPCAERPECARGASTCRALRGFRARGALRNP